MASSLLLSLTSLIMLIAVLAIYLADIVFKRPTLRFAMATPKLNNGGFREDSRNDDRLPRTVSEKSLKRGSQHYLVT